VSSLPFHSLLSSWVRRVLVMTQVITFFCARDMGAHFFFFPSLEGVRSTPSLLFSQPYRQANIYHRKKSIYLKTYCPLTKWCLIFLSVNKTFSRTRNSFSHKSLKTTRLTNFLKNVENSSLEVFFWTVDFIFWYLLYEKTQSIWYMARVELDVCLLFMIVETKYIMSSKPFFC